ncbi:MAG: HNH endonuclease signature motif containing protein [Minisyncoccia bacterium]
MFDSRCFYCGCKLTMETVRMNHIIPIKYGGKYISNNTVPCCQECRDFKGYLIPPKKQLEIFIQRIENARREYHGDGARSKGGKGVRKGVRGKIQLMSRKDIEKWKDFINKDEILV